MDSTRRLIAKLDRLEGHCEQPAISSECSVAQIRRRTLEQGAPAGALAHISIGSDPECNSAICAAKPHSRCCVAKAKSWNVSVIDRGESLFEARIADDCQGH